MILDVDPLAGISFGQFVKDFGPLGGLVFIGAMLAGAGRDAITAWAASRRAASAPPQPAPGPLPPVQVIIPPEAVQAAVEAASSGWREGIEGRVSSTERWIEEEERRREIVAAEARGAERERARTTGDFAPQGEPTSPGGTFPGRRPK